MNETVKVMLAAYLCKSVEDQERALREIIQEIALLGLWRAKFFEHAAFYGGTALRMLYGLDRFSEDLDFTLLAPDSSFTIARYEKAIATELAAFDFDVTVERKVKSVETQIDSAFIKANTLVHLLKIGAPWKTQRSRVMKIKLEVDTQPPPEFATEVLPHFRPIPFSIKTLTMPDLFAGKLHALLFRERTANPKGRDWYDLLWYVGRGTLVHLAHLEERARQSGHWQGSTTLTRGALAKLLEQKLAATDLEALKADVRPFVRDQARLEAWTPELFRAAFARVTA
jgi:predicted nucleotidyltransferase component of viral defense system